MSTVKKAASIVISVVMWIIILVAALFAFTTLATKDDGSVSNLGGFTPLTVQSESMEPTFGENDLIIIQQCDPSTLQVGDIVTFHTIIDNQYALNTHRIVSINEVNGMNSYTTKGEAAAAADERAQAEAARAEAEAALAEAKRLKAEAEAALASAEAGKNEDGSKK